MRERQVAAGADAHSIGEPPPDEIVDLHLRAFRLAGEAHLEPDQTLAAARAQLQQLRLYAVGLRERELIALLRKLRHWPARACCLIQQ